MSSQNNGFIKIHRRLLDWQWYQSTNHVRLFVHILLTANYKETAWRKEKIMPGQLLTGLNQLSANTSLSIQSVRTVLKDLISTNEITIKTTNKYRIITVINWNLYQDTNKQANNQLTNNQQTTNNIQEYKECKKEKNIEYSCYLQTWEKAKKHLAENYNINVPSLTGISEKRKDKIRLRHAEGLTIEVFEQLLESASQSDFLMGLKEPSNGHPVFRLTFDWIFENDTNWRKIMEGNYANQKN